MDDLPCEEHTAEAAPGTRDVVRIGDAVASPGGPAEVPILLTRSGAVEAIVLVVS